MNSSHGLNSARAPDAAQSAHICEPCTAVGKISLLVLTYNWPAALTQVLASVAAQRRLPDEILIVDDGSGDETARVVRDFQSRLSVPVHHLWQEDRGFRAARARNLGIAASRGDYVVMIDGDMILHPCFLQDHLALSKPGAFLQGGRIKATAVESQRLLAGGRPVFRPWSAADFDHFDGSRRWYAFRQPLLARCKAWSGNRGRIMSCNMSFWRQDLLRVNGFDERMDGYGAEDCELAARLHYAGVQQRALKWAGLAVHLWHPSRAAADVNSADLPNNQLLRQTHASRQQRCEHGVDGHTDFLTGTHADHLRPSGLSS